MSDPKDRVRKLIRLAVDKGATEAERANAAIRACTMIDEHNFLDTKHIYVPPAPPTQRRSVRYPRAEDIANAIFEKAVRPTPFRSARAGFTTECGIDGCEDLVLEGDTCWSRYKGGQIEYVHADCWFESGKA